MKTFKITIFSRNQHSVNKFFSLFINNVDSNFTVIKKHFQNKRAKKIITILKSPHVNKKAQEQFENKLF